MKKLKTLAVIPAFNEQGKIGITVRKAKPFVDKVLVADDCSKDKTAAEAKKAGAIVISHKANQGAGAAIRTGIDYAIRHGFDVCIDMGGDDQDNPDEIPRLMKEISAGFDFVQGSRWLSEGKRVNIPLFRVITTKSYSFFFSILEGFPITDGSNGFRAFRTKMFTKAGGKINLWQDWLNRYELEPYMYHYAIKHYKVKEAPVTKRYPKDKRKKKFSKMIPLVDWWRITRPLIFLKLGLKK